MKSRNTKNNELFLDYKLFDGMSKELKTHYKKVLKIRSSISKNKKASSDLKFEVLESLDIILDHVKKASKELDKSKRVIKEL